MTPEGEGQLGIIKEKRELYCFAVRLPFFFLKGFFI